MKCTLKNLINNLKTRIKKLLETYPQISLSQFHQSDPTGPLLWSTKDTAKVIFITI